MFPDTDPGVLYNVYVQVGRNKELLIECMLNGGVVDQNAMEQEQNDEDDFGGIIDLDDQADPETIQRQIQMIESAHQARQNQEARRAARREAQQA